MGQCEDASVEWDVPPRPELPHAMTPTSLSPVEWHDYCRRLLQWSDALATRYDDLKRTQEQIKVICDVHGIESEDRYDRPIPLAGRVSLAIEAAESNTQDRLGSRIEQLEAVQAEQDDEIAALRGQLRPQGQWRFFSYNQELAYPDFHHTAEDAQKAAQYALDTYQKQAQKEGQWPDNTDTVCWGVVLEQVQRCEAPRPEPGPDGELPNASDHEPRYELTPTADEDDTSPGAVQERPQYPNLLDLADGLSVVAALQPGGASSHRYPGIVQGRFQFTSNCAHGCGAWMGGSRAGGPEGVDPLGTCPKAPGVAEAGER